jgi:ABC-type glycerol-3-phosphate transport system substrate-binding protein
MTRTIWLLAAMAAAGGAAAQSMDQLYEAAKKEGALVLYGGGPAPPYERFAKDFEQRFPGIKVARSRAPASSSTGCSGSATPRSSIRS